MKIYFAILLITLCGISCKTGVTQSNQDVIFRVNNKIESGSYTFVPQTAIPTGGRSVNLNYSYSMKVSKDTIDSYLPYFGRAYTAPMSSDDSGIKFVSTDFDYKISDKKKGMWNVSINTKDTRRKYNISLKIGDTGYATLTVHENDRQSISFYGKIE